MGCACEGVWGAVWQQEVVEFVPCVVSGAVIHQMPCWHTAPHQPRCGVVIAWDGGGTGCAAARVVMAWCVHYSPPPYAPDSCCEEWEGGRDNLVVVVVVVMVVVKTALRYRPGSVLDLVRCCRH